jgi:hypothetical protein
MTKLQPLDAFGVSAEFFKITTRMTPTEAFTYYTFTPEGKWSLESQGSWELVGIRYRADDDPQSLAARFLHLEEEDVEEDMEEDLQGEGERADFEAERDAGSYISVQPAEMAALLTLFEGWARTLRAEGDSLMPQSEELVRFHPLSREELAALGITAKHLPLLVAPHGTFSFFRYDATNSSPLSDKIRLLHFSAWSSLNTRTAARGIGYNEYVRQRAGPGESGDAVEIRENTLLLDAIGAQQFAQLLRRHSWPSQ